MKAPKTKSILERIKLLCRLFNECVNSPGRRKELNGAIEKLKFVNEQSEFWGVECDKAYAEFYVALKDKDLELTNAARERHALATRKMGKSLDEYKAICKEVGIEYGGKK